MFMKMTICHLLLDRISEVLENDQFNLGVDGSMRDTEAQEREGTRQGAVFERAL